MTINEKFASLYDFLNEMEKLLHIEWHYDIKTDSINIKFKEDKK
jgi:hypothetical protein